MTKSAMGCENCKTRPFGIIYCDKDGNCRDCGRPIINPVEQAQKPPTDMAGLVEELLNACAKSEEAISDPQVATVFTRWIRQTVSRYRPAPSSADEGLEKELKDIDWMACQAMKEWDGVDIAKVPKELHGYRAILAKVDGILTMLSRHPSTKSDRCGELAKRLRVYKLRLIDEDSDFPAPSTWRGDVIKELETILSEFSKDADGKEGR